MIERVLVGVDGSEAAGHALIHALRLARVTGADVRAVHVLESPALYGAGPSVDPRIVEAREEVGWNLLDDAADRAGQHDVALETGMGDGRPAGVLAAEADEWRADVVVVGTQGHGAIARAIVGSVADELVRSAPAPVVTVREAPRAEPSDALERIVVPSDGSEAARAAIPFAVGLADATGAELDLLFAITPELEGGAYLDRPVTEIEAAHEEMAEEALAPIEEACTEAGVGCERFVVRAPAHRAIVDHAGERGADLVVMATRGRGGIERFLLGSVTDKVVRMATTPVATVRPDES